MRKIVSVLLLVVLFCGLLVGCKKNRVMRDDFKNTTNQLVSMKGFYFKVPKAWEERESSTEKKYYDTEDGMLTVQYAKTSGSIFDKAVRQNYVFLKV